MNLFHTIILSIVEGLSEFLPISSTAHLIYASKLLQIPTTDFSKTFEIFIQLGAILAVLVLYTQKIIHSKKLWKSLFFSFLPTSIIGLVLYKFIKSYLLSNSTIPSISLIIGGLIMIWIDKRFHHHPENKSDYQHLEHLPISKSIIIGIFQSLAVIPGVSRSAASIIGGLFCGLNRSESVEYSFLLAIPTIAAATTLDLFKSYHSLNSTNIPYLLIGFVGAFISALIAVKFFITYISKNNFKIFSIYRIAIGIFFLWLLK